MDETLGERDVESINKIYSFCNNFCRILELKFNFKEDSGQLENAIIFDEYGNVTKPLPTKGWGFYKKQKILVPDILDYNNKIIIEFEETWKKKGKQTLKGHDPDGLDRRTSDRDFYYELGNFHVLKIFDYDSTPIWKRKIATFLLDL